MGKRQKGEKSSLSVHIHIVSMKKISLLTLRCRTHCSQFKLVLVTAANTSGQGKERKQSKFWPPQIHKTLQKVSDIRVGVLSYDLKLTIINTLHKQHC